ncbi:MAG: hypothetical protein RAK19_00730 [Synechococcus sp. SP1 MAG]|nr:hypothetical protein [Synechococcus sp. SP1 MAG]
MNRSRSAWILLVVAVVCAGFALKALWLIDATALWSDELYSVGKSFQASPAALLAMLRHDTHPPLYYGLLWGWGQLVGQSPITLRLLSWLAYGAGGIVMVAQARALAADQRLGWTVPLAALMAFCSPYPIRFSIEGKSYALLVLVVALAWWWRNQGRLVPYAIAVALASLTHFYGLFLMLAAAAWDGWRRRWGLSLAAGLGAIPALAWMVYAAEYLFSSKAGSWIGGPSFALLEDTLARGLGVWPLPKLALLLLTVVTLRRWGGLKPVRWFDADLWDRSGVIPSALMVLGVVLISLFKPLAFSRYFVVLIPALVPVLAVLFGDAQLNRGGRLLAGAVLVIVISSWWGPGFAELDPGLGGVREQDQFRMVSQQTDGFSERFSPRARLLNLSDRMEQEMGRISSPEAAWGDHRALRQRLLITPQPAVIWLASSGPEQALRRKLNPLQQEVEQVGYRCVDRSKALSHGRILQCQLESKLNPSL